MRWAARAVTHGLLAASLVAVIVDCSSFSATADAADAGADSDLSADALASETSPPGLVPLCMDGACDCDGEPANGRETRVDADDALNCGACRRACPVLPEPLPAPQCHAGVCTAGIVASNQLVTAIAARDDGIAWGDLQTVRSASPPDWTPTALVTAPYTVSSIAMNASHIYATFSFGNDLAAGGDLIRFTRGKVCDADAAGCVDHANNGLGMVGVTLMPDTLVFTRRGSGNNTDEVRSIGLDLVGDGNLLFTAPFVDSVAATDKVYMAKHVETLGANQIEVRPLTCPPATPTTCNAAILKDVVTRSIAVDADYVYFSDVRGQKVTRARTNGQGTIDTLATTLWPVTSVAIDARDIYWSELDAQGKSSIHRVGKDGTCKAYAPCPQILAADIAGFGGFALAETSLYYGTSVGTAGAPTGRVYRLPK